MKFSGLLCGVLCVALVYGQCEPCEYNYHCVENECQHIDLMPVVANQAIGWIFIMMIIGISTVVGLGGGIEKIPILICLLNYSIDDATHLTYAAMLGCSITNFCLLFNQRHFTLEKPIIDYDIALILVPTVAIGADLGVTLLDVLDPLVELLIIIVLMTGFAPVMIRIGTQLRANEERQRVIDTLRSSLISLPDHQFNTVFASGSGLKARTFSEVSVLSQTDRDIYIKWKKHDKHYIPKTTLCYIVGIYVLLTGLTVMRGGNEVPSILLIEYRSTGYWLFSCFILIVLLAFSYFIKKHLELKQAEMGDVGYLARRGDLLFDWPTYSRLWLIGVGTSFMGGLTGLGSGSLLVPLLIVSNVEPRTAAATSGFVKLFISASTTVLALINRQLDYSDMFFFGALGFLGTFFLTYSIYQVINERRYQYPFVIIVAAFLVLNAFAALLGIIKLYWWVV